MSGQARRDPAPGELARDALGREAPGKDAPGPAGADGDGKVWNGSPTNGGAGNGGAGNDGARNGGAGNAKARSGAGRAGTDRDHQRARVYRAEDLVARILDRSAEFPVVQLAGSSVTLPIERKFGDIASVQRYVDAVLELPWVRQEWLNAATPVTVRERQGPARAHYERVGHTIALPLHRGTTAWALRELVVLHEIAHHFAEPIEEPHGPEFTARLLRLVDCVIGAEAAFVLRVSLLDVGAAIG